MTRLRICLCLLFGSFTAGQAAAGEVYFMAVFGAQRPVVNLPDHAHSFAVFLRGCGQGPDITRYQYDFVIISWLPKTLEVRTLAVLPEPGVNLDLHTTIRWAQDDRLKIAVWGPYQIDADLYQRAVRQTQVLASGQVKYKAVDTGYPSDEVSNCIHAIGELAGTPRIRIASPGWGHYASYYLTLRLRPWIIDEQHTHDWLLDGLGIGHCDIERRGLDNSPTVRPLLRATQTLIRPAYR